MKILVTGGAGFIGSNLVESLLNAGHQVRVLDNFSLGKRENLEGLKGDLEVIEGGIEFEKDCEKACADGIEVISHQAAYGSVPRSIKFPEIYSHTNLHGFVNMANAARKRGIKRFVYASSSSVYGTIQDSPKIEDRIGTPLSPYAASKLSNEIFAHAFCASYEMTMVGLRYFNVFGPRQSPEGAYAAVIPLFANYHLGGPVAKINGDGEQSRDFTYIENVIQANTQALLHDIPQDSHVVNIACGYKTSVNQLFQKIAQLTNSSRSPEYNPPRAGDVANSLASIEKAKNLLKYKGDILMDEGLEKTIAWFKKQFD